MEKLTAKQYVENLASNQTDREDWERGYPDGMSVEDLCSNDTVDVFDDNADFITDCGERMLLTDGVPNFGTRYEI